ncbi:MAG: formate dehydrogenase accessory protein FdhE [candidate division KSB1 bacterium]|nr:formate dehydrogenase accessory protein FdhE [candidate division KSB1 bacterium]
MTLEAQINFLKKRGQFDEAYLLFLRQILTFQSDLKAKINREKLAILGRTSDVDSRLQMGLPLLEKNNIYIEGDAVHSDFAQFLLMLENYPQEYPPENITALRNLFNENDRFPDQFIQAFVAENKDYFSQLSQAYDIAPGTLIFIAKTVSLPFLEALAELLKPYLDKKNEVWLRPFCPLCGNFAGMARLEKENRQRHLWCATCHTEWAFHRNQCPYCSNNHPNGIRYFFDDNEPLYRVYICDECKRYLKTVDEKNYGYIHPLQLELEDMITYYLDEIAVKEGYRSPLWWYDLDMPRHAN